MLVSRIILSFKQLNRPLKLSKKHYLLGLYFLLLLILAPSNLPLSDTFYYWEWSRHLALSYYDGPPLIAYFIKCSTLIFGDTLFALAFVGIAVTAVTSRIIYKTARFFLNEDASYVAAIVWLFSPQVTLSLLKQTTYDTPLTLFWALIIYYVVSYIKTNKNNYLYAIGISIGLLLLAKYSGVVLVLGLGLFLLMTPYRALFKNKHFYFSMIIAMLIFSPVLYWNYQHDWLSFTYQLTTHQSTSTEQPLMNMLKGLLIILSALNLMLFPPLLCWFKSTTKMPVWVSFCLVICTTVFGFYLLTSSDSMLHGGWLSQFLITSALLAGYCFQTFRYHRIFYALIGIYICVSIALLLNGSFHIAPSKGLKQYESIQQLNDRHLELPKVIVTTGWFQARNLFFLKGKPAVYTLSCGQADTLENQYKLWSRDVAQDIQNKKIKEVLYIDTYDRVHCMKPYFERCQALPIDDSSKSQQSIFAYICSNI